MTTTTARSASIADVPILPNDVEDYVAALFQTAGYYVEKNIVERVEGENVLELDAVATDYSSGTPSSVVVEAKSSDSGFADAFKVLGWMTYLSIGRGALFTAKEGRDAAFMNDKLSPLGLSYCVLGDCSEAFERFAQCGFPRVTDSRAVDLWRFSYGMERRLLYDLRAISKATDAGVGSETVQRYVSLIRDETFFQPAARQRARALYDAFNSHPKLSLGCAREIEGAVFDAKSDGPTNSSIAAAMYRGDHPLLQASFYAEHRARLAILKAAIDFFGECGASADQVLEGLSDWTAIISLPASFRAGLLELSRDEYFPRYALFWQVFLWGWGGFYLLDREPDELALMGAQSGIPAAKVPQALRAMDVLFPMGSWIASNGPSQIQLVKMVPFCMRAIGAFQRLARYGVSEYADLGYTDYTGTDLLRWHNAGIAFWNVPRKGF